MSVSTTSTRPKTWRAIAKALEPIRLKCGGYSVVGRFHRLPELLRGLNKLKTKAVFTVRGPFRQEEENESTRTIVWWGNDVGGGDVVVSKTEEEWKAVLSTEQFRILRQKGTELRSTGEYNKFFEEGVYDCAGCGTPLYKSTTKFDSGCGWPAFFEGLPGAISRSPDPDGRRTEIICTACGGHLGHLYPNRRAPLCQQCLCQIHAGEVAYHR